MAKKRFSAIDHAWLRLDEPSNLMIITGLMTFDKALDVDYFKFLVEKNLLHFDRFRQKITNSHLPFLPPYWEDDEDFNINHHIEHITLPEPGDQKALQETISVLMSTGLDYDKPLWKFYIVDEYNGGSALIARLHHCIADGIALMYVLLSMTSTEPDVAWPEPTLESSGKPQEDALGERLMQLRKLMENASESRKKILDEISRLSNDQKYRRERAQSAMGIAGAAAKLVLRWPDPKTAYKGPLGISKRAAWSDPLALDDIKMIGKVNGGTVNDVLMTLVAGALSRYLSYLGEPVDELEIRGFIPINIRPLNLASELGNKFSIVFLSLPLGIQDSLQRLNQVKRNMDALKASPEAIAAYGILTILGVVPYKIQNIGIQIFDTKGSAVMTNVPGPRMQLYMAGAPVNTVMAWVPQSGRIGLGVSILSYNGKVWLGLATDEGLVPDPERILGFFCDEFSDLMSRSENIQANKIQPIKPMISELESSLQVVDALLAEYQQPEILEIPLCQGTTKSGNPCKNRALAGESYCRVHLKVG